MLRATAAVLALSAALTACVAPRGSAPGSTASAPSAQGAGPPAARAPQDAVAKTTVICTTERPIGSNIAKRVCRREEDLDRARAQTRDDLVRMMQQASAQPRRD